ncbi:MAG: sodium:proton antiporter [Patescibacteria group bacterium]
MDITLSYVLALFTLLTIASSAFFLAKKVRLPYTVLLVAIGVILVPLAQFFPFIKEFTLTPNLLFYVFLPILLFESAYNMEFRKIMENVRSISALAFISLLFSAFFIAGAMYLVFNFFGFPIPFIVALLFASLISSTDPVAVLALFKEYGAPKRLALIFEGESIFNDATAVALFLVVLEIAQSGFHGAASVVHGIFIFIMMLTFGLVFGTFMGWVFSKFIQYTRDNEFVSITLTLVVSHLTFILSELISEHLILFGQEVKLSPIIATTAAALVLGNYGRYKISIRAEEYVEKVWGQFAFIANSLVFILMGLIFISVPIAFTDLIWPIIASVIIVAVGRALSIYPIVGFVNWRKKEAHIPMSWQHLLAWGSLRGALAIMVGLLIPDSLSIPGWTHALSPKEFILAVTIGCIYATIFLKATTIGLFIKKLKISDLTDIEKIEREESMAMINSRVLGRLADFYTKGYIDKHSYEIIKVDYEKGLEQFLSHRQEHHRTKTTHHERVLRMYALGIEKHFLKELFLYNEISEHIFKKILKKLTLQREQLEKGTLSFDPYAHDPSGFIERTSDYTMKVLRGNRDQQVEEINDAYLYYRALAIILRKVIKELEQVTVNYPIGIFEADSLDRTIKLYGDLRVHAQKRMEEIHKTNPNVIGELNTRLTLNATYKVTEIVLNDLYKKEMLSQKVYINLKDELLK